MVCLTECLPTIQVSIKEVIMGIQWKYKWYKIFVWLMAEVIFSMLGVDDLADYSEFIFEQKMPVLISQQWVVK